ncbi:MAG: peptidoglycan-binding protein [Oculatellaceae cyanobacterium Prado106]|nr:peptidoglycan-binding protein [Oculatellaceae cyanobacterium Prado106]
MEILQSLHAKQEQSFQSPAPANHPSLTASQVAIAPSRLNFPRKLALMVLGLACSMGCLSFTEAAQAQALLRQGDSGAEVVRLQDLLRTAGFFPSSSTGFFGPVTPDAVQAFQRARRLEADGIAGGQTWSALGAGTSAGTSAGTPSNPGTTAATPTPSPSSDVVQFGDRSNAVSQVQDLLRRAGYFNGQSTGFFGTVTQDSVIRFQRDRQLTADGVVGRSTLTALQNAAPVGTGTGGTRPTANTSSPAPSPNTTVTRPSNSTGGVGGTSSIASRPPLFGRVLRPGDNGDDVRLLQQRLAALNYYTGPITGQFGELTTTAVRDFQRDKNLDTDGIVGLQTAELLR